MLVLIVLTFMGIHHENRPSCVKPNLTVVCPNHGRMVTSCTDRCFTAAVVVPAHSSLRYKNETQEIGLSHRRLTIILYKAYTFWRRQDEGFSLARDIVLVSYELVFLMIRYYLLLYTTNTVRYHRKNLSPLLLTPVPNTLYVSRYGLNTILWIELHRWPDPPRYERL